MYFICGYAGHARPSGWYWYYPYLCQRWGGGFLSQSEGRFADIDLIQIGPILEI